MKKINYKRTIIYILIVTCIFFLKKSYFDSMSSSLSSIDIRSMLVLWGDNQFINLVWFVPILLEIYIIANCYFDKITSFNTRLKNRRRYINRTIINFLIYSIVIIIAIVLLQMIEIYIFTDYNFIIKFNDISFIIQYIIENILLIVSILLIALLIKNLMFSLIMIIIIIFLTLTSIISLTLISSELYYPFINLYLSNNYAIISALIIIIQLIAIKRIYLKRDIGGIE